MIIYAGTWPRCIITCEIISRTSLVKIVIFFGVEKIKKLVTKLNVIFLEQLLLDYTSSVSKTHISIIKEVMYRFFIVIGIEVRTYENFLHKNLLKPGLELRVICARFFHTPLVIERNNTKLGRVPITLKRKIKPIRAIVVLNPIHLNFCQIIIKKVSSDFAFGKRYIVTLIVPVTT